MSDLTAEVEAFLAAGAEAYRIYAEAMNRVAEELAKVQWPETGLVGDAEVQ